VIIATLRVVVPPHCREEINGIFWMVMGPVRAEPGCLGCGLYEQLGEGNVLLYVELWEKPEQLERHMRSVRYERLLVAMEASARPPVLNYYCVSSIQGLEYLKAVRLGARHPPGRQRKGQHKDNGDTRKARDRRPKA
jgi:quinol monooxygenase YgiN